MELLVLFHKLTGAEGLLPRCGREGNRKKKLVDRRADLGYNGENLSRGRSGDCGTDERGALYCGRKEDVSEKNC